MPWKMLVPDFVMTLTTRALDAAVLGRDRSRWRRRSPGSCRSCCWRRTSRSSDRSCRRRRRGRRCPSPARRGRWGCRRRRCRSGPGAKSTTFWYARPIGSLSVSSACDGRRVGDVGLVDAAARPGDDVMDSAARESFRATATARRLLGRDEVARRDVGLEAGDLDADRVGARRQQREGERAPGVGDAGALEALLLAGQLDGDARQRAAGFVADVAGDRAEERSVGERRLDSQDTGQEKKIGCESHHSARTHGLLFSSRGIGALLPLPHSGARANTAATRAPRRANYEAAGSEDGDSRWRDEETPRICRIRGIELAIKKTDGIQNAPLTRPSPPSRGGGEGISYSSACPFFPHGGRGDFLFIDAPFLPPLPGGRGLGRGASLSRQVFVLRSKGRIARARKLRHDLTDCERLLRQRLRPRGLEGIKFRRQHPVAHTFSTSSAMRLESESSSTEEGMPTRSKESATTERSATFRASSSMCCDSGTQMCCEHGWCAAANHQYGECPLTLTLPFGEEGRKGAPSVVAAFYIFPSTPMAQIFHRSTNTVSRVSVFGAVFFLALLLWLFDALNRSPYTTQQGVARVQPVQFSHQHHVGAMGIDCRYCHTTVERAAFANIPPTKTCMNCHSQIWAQSPELEPVRESWRTDRVDRVGQGLRPARLRLLQPLDPRRQGRRLRDLPRPRRPDAARLAAPDAPDVLVPGLPPRAGEDTCARATRSSRWATCPRGTRKRSARGSRPSTRSGRRSS